MERRRTIRLLAKRANVVLNLPDGSAMGDARPLVDISEGGIRYAIPGDSGDAPAPGTELKARLEVLGRVFEVDCRVLHLHEPEGGSREVSLEFAELSQKDRESIRSLLLDLAMEKLAAGKVATPPDRTCDRPEGNRIGDILIANCSLSRDSLDRFIKEQYRKDSLIGRQLVKHGLVRDSDLAAALSEQAGLQFVDLELEGVDLLKIRQFGEAFLMQHLFVPIALDGRTLTVASANALGDDILNDIRKQFRRAVRNVIASEHQIMSAIQKAFHISRNKRRSARFPAGLSLRYKFYDHAWQPLYLEVLYGLTKNVSESGILFLGPLPPDMEDAPSPEAHTHVGVHMFLPEQEDPIRVPCQLVRSNTVKPEDEADKRPLCLYAVRILAVSDEDKRRLNLFRLQSYLPRQDRTLRK